MKKQFKVGGMSCEHCQKRVENAIKELDGVSAVAVILDDGIADVDFDDAILAESAIIAAIEDAGYDVE